MKSLFIPLVGILLLGQQTFAQDKIVEKSYIERVINTLASDEMRGRHALTPDAERAADFIAQEFKDAGLLPYAQDDFKQTFSMKKIKKKQSVVNWGGIQQADGSYLIMNSNPSILWKPDSNIKQVHIMKGDDFSSKFREYALAKENLIVLVDTSFASYIARFNKIYGREDITSQNNQITPSKAFIVTDKTASNYSISHENEIENVSLSNVAAMIPGKSSPHEYVIFSGHYDHIGILKADGQDSIANGADDDASGITAVTSLAKYYKQQDNNARTLIFVAFTAEEIGMFGSKYFSSNMNADSVVAMINIEMIGKDSKFGPNSLYITGYEHSDLGKLMQENLKGSSFTFHPDPYSKQNLFYRSDNAVLAALGVPAHTFSTSQIDKDSYYHTVKDEVSTLDLENIRSSIEAIALGAKGIVEGKQTPSRVEKLKD